MCKSSFSGGIPHTRMPCLRCSSRHAKCFRPRTPRHFCENGRREKHHVGLLRARLSGKRHLGRLTSLVAKLSHQHTRGLQYGLCAGPFPGLSRASSAYFFSRSRRHTPTKSPLHVHLSPSATQTDKRHRTRRPVSHGRHQRPVQQTHPQRNCCNRLPAYPQNKSQRLCCPLAQRPRRASLRHGSQPERTTSRTCRYTFFLFCSTRDHVRKNRDRTLAKQAGSCRSPARDQ